MKVYGQGLKPLLLAVIVALYGAAVASPAASRDENIAQKPDVFTQFHKWCQDYELASSNQQAQFLLDGVVLAEQRRQMLKRLIVGDPKRALAVSMTEKQREKLPPDIAGKLEEWVSGIGDIRVIRQAGKAKYPSSDGLVRTVAIKGRIMEAHVFGWRLVDQDITGLPLHGVVVDGIMAVAESPVRKLDPGQAPHGKGRTEQLTAVVGNETLLFDTNDDLAKYEQKLMYPTGMSRPGPKARAERAKSSKVLFVRPNQLARQRINASRKQKGLSTLSAATLNVAPLGEELVMEGALQSGASGSFPSAGGTVDNSALNYFPPIRNQGSIGSCAAFSTTYYQMTHMTAMVCGWDAKNGGDDYRFSPKWTYNMINGGTDGGSVEGDSLAVGRDHGLATWNEFPYDSNYREWCLNSNVWYHAIPRRMNNYSTINNLYTSNGLANLKAVLDNGYVVTFDTYSPWPYSGWVQKTVGNDPSTTADDPYVGQQICAYVRTQSWGHAMTIVGYNDDIWCDLNGNGVVDDGEKGALKIANSWGTWWGNSGYVWFAYDALKTDSSVSGWNPSDKAYGFGEGDSTNECLAYVVTAKTNYSPRMIAQFTINHALREQVIMKVAKDVTTVTNNPVAPWTPYGLSGEGGAYAFDGSSTPCDGTFCLDLTDVNPVPGILKRYFISLRDTNSDLSAGVIKSVTFMDMAGSNNITITPSMNPGSFNPSNGVADGSTVWGWADLTFDALHYRSLTVVSAQGGAVPAVGTNAYLEGTNLCCSVTNSPLYKGVQSTQYVCTGWVMRGNEPTNGITTNCLLTLTNDAVLTWNWATNYWLQIGATNGELNSTSSWFSAGTSLVVTATSSSGYYFICWSGNTNGCLVDSNRITIAMTQSRAITAICARVYYVNDSSTGNDAWCSNVGDDANDGLSVSTPKLTVQGILSEYDLEPGDVVRIDTGTYNLTNDITVTAADGGSTAAPVVFEASPYGVVINRNYPTSGYAWYINGAGYVTIRTAVGTNGPGMVQQWMKITGANYGLYLQSGNYTTLNRLDVWSNNTYGVRVSSQYATLNNLLVRNTYSSIGYGVRVGGINGTVNNCTVVQTNATYGIYIGSAGCRLANNIIIVDGGSRYAIYAASLPTASDYNDLYVANGAYAGYYNSVARTNLTDWKVATGKDTNSLSADPLFADVTGGDYHLKSKDGRYVSDGIWTNDTASSPCIDAGDTNSAYSLEPAPNGSRINLGVYGNTEQASRSTTNVLLTLTVTTAPGDGVPGSGTYKYNAGVELQCAVTNSPLYIGLLKTQYVCSGWIATGSLSNGSGTNVSFVISNDTVIVWQWQTNYWLSTIAGTNGSFDQTNQWVNSGCNVVITATASNYYHFDSWAGDTNDCPIAGNQITAWMVSPRTIMGTFSANMATNNTPHWWLAQYGLPTNDTGALYDDGDGMPAWQEYLADTDPTNSQSVLSLTGIVPDGNAFRIQWKGGQQVMQYLQYKTNLDSTAEDWITVYTNVPPTYISNSVPIAGMTNNKVYYRIKVQR